MLQCTHHHAAVHTHYSARSTSLGGLKGSYQFKDVYQVCQK